ncbi:ribosome maturation factor RimM [Candidatus Latescibacterota bacterium]
MIPSHSGTLIAIGRIIKAQGLQGELKVYPLSDFSERFNRLEDVKIEFESGKVETFEVEKVRNIGRFVIFKLKGVDDRNNAEYLCGSYVCVTRDEIFPLDEESFYMFELEGMEVFNPEERKIGEISLVEKYPAQDIIIIETEDRNIMVPAVKDFLVDIDVKKGRIILDLPEGLPSYPRNYGKDERPEV